MLEEMGNNERRRGKLMLTKLNKEELYELSEKSKRVFVKELFFMIAQKLICLIFH